jgi:leucyl-tRNA synthetase
VSRLTTAAQRASVEAYVAKVGGESDLDRAAKTEKTGVFTGATAVNPVNGERIPVWISDYVLMGYGTGAIMAVPAHDERDYAFAKTFGLEIREVIGSDAGVESAAHTGPGPMKNSGPFTGMPAEEGRREIVRGLESKGLGRATVQYKLRDWVFSRQRYWGEPIPIVHCAKCGPVPVAERDLPLRLPEVEKYQPTGTGESPLAAIAAWVNVPCPHCGGPGQRETDTMPQWAGSSWYFLRYASPHSTDALLGPEGKQWLPVDLYVGGVEHAVLHLLYARFFTMVLFDIGVVDFEEPFKRLFNQGMITYVGKSGKAEKMSKSKGNVVNPDQLVVDYGCDSLRLYELFVGPPDLDAEWNDNGIEGVHRFLKRAWHWVLLHNGAWSAAPPREMRVERHRLIKNVSERLEALRMNTLVSAFMEFLNAVTAIPEAPDRETVEAFLVAIAPFAPHFAEELWQRTGHEPTIFHAKWPTWDAAYTVDAVAEIAVQINGKLRGTVKVDAGATEDAVVAAAAADAQVARHLEGKTIRKRIYVRGRVLNLVVG